MKFQIEKFLNILKRFFDEQLKEIRFFSEIKVCSTSINCFFFHLGCNKSYTSFFLFLIDTTTFCKKGLLCVRNVVIVGKILYMKVVVLLAVDIFFVQNVVIHLLMIYVLNVGKYMICYTQAQFHNSYMTNLSFFGNFPYKYKNYINICCV